MIIPYLTALAFLFLFIAKSSYQLFLEFDLASYFIVWAIGYEICMVFALIIFFYSWFSDDSSDDTPKNSESKHNGIHPRFRN
jgi:type IV secretory pathway TrbL component